MDLERQVFLRMAHDNSSSNTMVELGWMLLCIQKCWWASCEDDWTPTLFGTWKMRFSPTILFEWLNDKMQTCHSTRLHLSNPLMMPTMMLTISHCHHLVHTFTFTPRHSIMQTSILMHFPSCLGVIKSLCLMCLSAFCVHCDRKWCPWIQPPPTPWTWLAKQVLASAGHNDSHQSAVNAASSQLAS